MIERDPMIRLMLVILIVAALGFSSCAPKEKEIPMETFVKMWFKAQSDDAFRKKYEKPIDQANAAELDVYAKPFGFSGNDLKYTYRIISKDSLKNSRFEDLRMDETLRPLNDKPDTSNIEIKK